MGRQELNPFSACLLCPDKGMHRNLVWDQSKVQIILIMTLVAISMKPDLRSENQAAFAELCANGIETFFPALKLYPDYVKTQTARFNGGMHITTSFCDR